VLEGLQLCRRHLRTNSFLGDNEKEEGGRRKKGFISSLIYCGQEQWKKNNKEKDKKEIGMAGGEDDRYAADLLDSPLPRSRSSRRRSEDNSARDGTPLDVSDGRENGSHRYREVRTFKCETKNLLYLKAVRRCEILLFCFPSPD
jgi:hypothetical protein